MTPKKNIVRKAVFSLTDGAPIPSMGKGFKPKENAFIYWFTNPKTEAFMNSGRAAVRAGYKPDNAVIYGYQLRQKPEIKKAVDEILGRTKDGMRALVYKIAFLCADRMFWSITDFYRECKRTVKDRWGEREVDSVEAIPLDEIPERKRLCIDQVTIKTIAGIDETWYILADRNKAEDTFWKCLEIMTGKKKTQIIRDLICHNDIFYTGEEEAAYIREDKPVETAPVGIGKGTTADWRKAAEFLRGENS